MFTSLCEGARKKPLCTDVFITAPRYKHGDNYITSCTQCLSFLGFSHTRRRHNASYYSICSGKSRLNPNANVGNNF